MQLSVRNMRRPKRDKWTLAGRPIHTYIHELYTMPRSCNGRRAIPQYSAPQKAKTAPRSQTYTQAARSLRSGLASGRQAHRPRSSHRVNALHCGYRPRF